MSRSEPRMRVVTRTFVVRAVAACCCGALVATVPGCSLVLVRGPPKEPAPTASVTCTESNAAPIVDVAFAVGWSALTIAAASDASQSCPPTQMCFKDLSAATAVMTGLFALASGASAAYGFSKASRCRDAVACTDGDRASCERLEWAPRSPEDVALRRALERDADLLPRLDLREFPPDVR